MAKLMQPQIQYATTPDSVSLAYYEMGEGPPLVMASTILWSHLRMIMIPEYQRSGAGIGRGRRVVRYDARGTGLSSRDTRDFSPESRLIDLECVVDHLGIERLALLAIQHGCPTAIAYAAAHPERVTHLLLWRPYARAKDAGSLWDPFASLRSAGDWDKYTTTMANVNMDFKDSVLAERVARRMRESMTLDSLEAFIEQSKSIDVSDLLPRIQCPTLVGWTEGVGVNLEITKAVAAGIPGARLFMHRRSGASRWSDQATKAIEEFLGDADPGPAPGHAEPSALRTVLFTDLVAHTEMMSRLGDERGRAVLREHERITREVLKANGGTEVKTMGDGFLASFGSVTKAVECAIALQRAFADWNHNPPPSTHNPPTFSVRVGLNAGEPIEEDGDLFGATVILASRIAAKADAGEILVADTVRGLCSGKGFLFADRGDFVAKGFEEPVRVYEVAWKG